MPLEVSGNPHLAQASSHEIETVHGLLKRQDARIVAGSGLDDHDRLVPNTLQTFVQPIGGPGSAP
jgi:hypothetical protein